MATEHVIELGNGIATFDTYRHAAQEAWRHIMTTDLCSGLQYRKEVYSDCERLGR